MRKEIEQIIEYKQCGGDSLCPECSQQTTEAILKVIAEMVRGKVQDGSRMYQRNEDWRIGYNQALSDILDELQK